MLKRYYADVINHISWKNNQGEDDQEESLRPLIGPEDLICVTLGVLYFLIFLLLIYHLPFRGRENFFIYLWSLITPLFLLSTGLFKAVGHRQNRSLKDKYWLTFVQMGWLWLSGLWLGSILMMLLF